MTDRRINDGQFGMSEREQAEISGKALAGHIFDTVEGAAMGEGRSFRDAFTAEAWNDTATHFPGADVRETEDGYPEVHMTHPGGTKSSYKPGGPYLNIHGPDGNHVDALHINEEDRFNPTAIQNRGDDHETYMNEEGY